MKFTPITLAALLVPILPLCGDTEPTATRSALLSGEEQSTHLASMRQRIVINSLERGPFGLSQDPDQKVIWEPPEPTDSLSDVLGDMKISVVIPADGLFLSQGRWFHQGETFSLLVDDREILMRVNSVKKDALVFQDLENGETATIVLRFLPQSLPATDFKITLPPGVAPKLPKGEPTPPFRLR